jgi:D-alanyl-D-alanine carboxypeptidase/D-alanyl-D-alanine-endopeptidase (penicillin-binding protein 4)
MLIAETLGPAAAADTIIRDGSGLSRDNRVTARTMARWLAAMHGDDEVRPMYLATLPSAEDKLAERLTTGPLSHRLAAKTGTINRVRCLSGYVYDESTGRAAAFSVLCNGLTTGESIRAAYRLQSDIVAAIDKHLAELSLPADPALAPEPAYGG